jgi:hypothetical protein
MEPPFGLGLTPVAVVEQRHDSGLDAAPKVGKAPSVTTPWAFAGKARRATQGWPTEREAVGGSRTQNRGR